MRTSALNTPVVPVVRAQSWLRRRVQLTSSHFSVRTSVRALMACAALSLTACFTDDILNPPNAESVVFLKSPTDVYAGQSVQFSAVFRTILRDDPTVIRYGFEPCGATSLTGSTTETTSIPGGTIDKTSGVMTASVVLSAKVVTVRVCATAGSKPFPPSESASLTIHSRVSEIVVSPQLLALKVGQTSKLSTVVGIVAGSPKTPEPIVTWTSSNPAQVTVDAQGTVTLVGSTGTQGVTISAQSEGFTGTTVVTSSRAPANILVTPTPNTLAVGQSVTLTAKLVDSDGASLPFTGVSVAWKSDNPALASVTAINDSTATLTGLAAGATTARATTSLGFSGVADVTVKSATASIATTIDLLVATGTTTRPVAGTGETVALNGTLALKAIVRDQSGTALTEAVTWSSSNPAVAVVDASTGVVTSKSAGTATIVAASSSVPTVRNSVAILVPAASGSSIPTAIILTPWVATTGVGQTAAVTAKVVDATGAATTCQLGFAVDRSAVGSVTSAGSTATLTGAAAGTTALRAYCNDYGSVVGLARFTVTDAQYPVAQVKITPRFVYFPASASVGSFQFVAATLDRTGAVITAPVVWAASNTTVTVDQTGKVSVPASTGSTVGGGATITATAAGQTDVAWVTYGNAGTIRGQVTSTAGQYVGVTTAWAAPSGGGAIVGQTVVNSDGYFYLVGLAPGSYTVVVNPTSAPQQQFPNVVVTAGQQTVVTVAPLATRVGGGGSALRP